VLILLIHDGRSVELSARLGKSSPFVYWSLSVPAAGGCRPGRGSLLRSRDYAKVQVAEELDRGAPCRRRASK